MSASIRPRSTAAVESRSSHSPIGKSVSLAKLRAKARVDCARGPSEPSMLIGRPSTKPTVRIARRDPDGLGAEIKPDQRPARGQQGCNLDQRQHRHGKWLARTIDPENARTMLRLSQPRRIKTMQIT